MSDDDRGQLPKVAPKIDGPNIERQGLIKFLAFCAALAGLMIYFGSKIVQILVDIPHLWLASRKSGRFHARRLTIHSPVKQDLSDGAHQVARGPPKRFCPLIRIVRRTTRITRAQAKHRKPHPALAHPMLEKVFLTSEGRAGQPP